MLLAVGERKTEKDEREWIRRRKKMLVWRRCGAFQQNGHVSLCVCVCEVERVEL